MDLTKEEMRRALELCADRMVDEMMSIAFPAEAEEERLRNQIAVRRWVAERLNVGAKAAARVEPDISAAGRRLREAAERGQRMKDDASPLKVMPAELKIPPTPPGFFDSWLAKLRKGR